MTKLYIFQGKVYSAIPDPIANTTPISEEMFLRLGGEIREEREPIDDVVDDIIGTISEKHALYPDIDVQEFIGVLTTQRSRAIRQWCIAKGVADSDIQEVDSIIHDYLADADRYGGVGYTELIGMVVGRLKASSDNDSGEEP